MRKEEPGEQAIATNRKAFFNYEVLDRFEAGVSLVGTEVKSIREGGLTLRDSYVEFRGGELFLVGCRIGPYSHGNMLNHAEGRVRKLLLHKREILKLGGKATEKGFTIIPLRAYLKNGRVKVEIGLARGKQTHDKREALKRKDIERETRQAVRSRRHRRNRAGPGGDRGGPPPRPLRSRLGGAPPAASRRCSRGCRGVPTRRPPRRGSAPPRSRP